MDSQIALQTAIYTALRADATIRSLVGNPARVFDFVPQIETAGTATTEPEKTTFPYVVIGDDNPSNFSTKSTDGQDHQVSINIWDRTHRGTRTIKQIMAAVYDVLHHASFSVSGHTLVLSHFQFSDIFPDPDGISRQRWGIAVSVQRGCGKTS